MTRRAAYRAASRVICFSLTGWANLAILYTTMPNQLSKSKRQFGVSLSRELIDRIAEHCGNEGIDRTELIRRATELYMEQEQKKRGKNTTRNKK